TWISSSVTKTNSSSPYNSSIPDSSYGYIQSVSICSIVPILSLYLPTRTFTLSPTLYFNFIPIPLLLFFFLYFQHLHVKWSDHAAIIEQLCIIKSHMHAGLDNARGH